MGSGCVIFALLAVPTLMNLRIGNSMETDLSTNTVHSLAVSFLFETVGVAADEHFVQGSGFNIPRREDREVAIIFGNLFLRRLPDTQKLATLLIKISHMTGNYYWKAMTPQLQASTMHIHYGVLKSAILEKPQLERMYEEESNKVSQQNLPPLRSAHIDLEGLQVLPRLKRLIRETIRTNEKFRKLTIHLRFAHYGSGLTRYHINGKPHGCGRCLTASAIIQLSHKLEFEELTQQIYDRALEEISSRMRNEVILNEDKIDKMIFSIIDETFQKDKNLYEQLDAIKGQLTKN